MAPIDGRIIYTFTRRFLPFDISVKPSISLKGCSILLGASKDVALFGFVVDFL